MAKAIVSGVYKIQNVTNGKCYVGSSLYITYRWNCHRRELRGGFHHSSKLQRAWNKYGEDAFVFSVLEEVGGNDSALLAVEQKWIDALNAVTGGYNVNPLAGRAAGVKRSPEVKKRLSDAHKGKRHSEETKRKISQVQIGRKQSQESKDKRSASLKGRQFSDSHLEKLAEARASMFTDEVRSKLSEKAKLRGDPVAARLKADEAKRGKKQSAQHIESRIKHLRGRKLSEERRMQLASVNVGRKHSEESKANMSAAHVGKVQSEETKEKRRQTWVRKRLEREAAKQQATT